MRIDASEYTITIQKVKIEDDVLFEATIKELPDIVEYAETHNEAYDLAIDTIDLTAEMLENDNIEMPKPYKRKEEYSGRVTLRLPKSLHKTISNLAEIDETSVNSYIVAAMSEKVAIGSFININLINSNFLSSTFTATSKPYEVSHQEKRYFSAARIVVDSTDKKILHVGNM